MMHHCEHHCEHMSISKCHCVKTQPHRASRLWIISLIIGFIRIDTIVKFCQEPIPEEVNNMSVWTHT